MSALDAVKNLLSRGRAKRSVYNLWTMTTSEAADLLNQKNWTDVEHSLDKDGAAAGGDGYTIREFTRDDLVLFDRARPGRRAVPEQYFAQGHECWAAFDEDGNLASYAWVFINRGEAPVVAKQYFLVQPGEAYLHAAWTDPKHRRRGLHTLLTQARMAHAVRDPQAKSIVTHVAVGLLSSESAFRTIGFKRTHKLTVARGGLRNLRNIREPIDDWDPDVTGSSGVAALGRSTGPRVLVLGADTPQSVALCREVSREADAFVIAGSSAHGSLASRSKHVDENVVLPKPDSPEYEDRVHQAMVALEPDVVIPTNTEAAAAAASIRERGNLDFELLGPANTMQAELQNRDGLDLIAAELGIGVAAGKADILMSSRASLLHYCGYFDNGKAVVEFQYEDAVVGEEGETLVSVTVSNRKLAELGRKLLAQIKYTGLADVVFRVGADGELLFERLNPQLWEEYALSSKSGAAVAPTALSYVFGHKEVVEDTPSYYRSTRMVHPLAELQRIKTDRKIRTVVDSLTRILLPKSKWDIELSDLKGDALYL